MRCQDLLQRDASKSVDASSRLEFQSFNDAEYPVLLVGVVQEEHVVLRCGSEMEQ